jgi:hypothetical protein
MEVTELGIVTLRKAQQPEKTFASMDGDSIGY